MPQALLVASGTLHVGAASGRVGLDCFLDRFLKHIALPFGPLETKQHPWLLQAIPSGSKVCVPHSDSCPGSREQLSSSSFAWKHCGQAALWEDVKQQPNAMHRDSLMPGKPQIIFCASPTVHRLTRLRPRNIVRTISLAPEIVANSIRANTVFKAMTLHQITLRC